MTPRHSVVLKVLLLGLSVVFSLGLAEVGLRLIAPSNPYSSAFPLYPYHRREILVTYKGQDHTIVQRMNRWGFRGDDPPTDWSHALTIIAVGGSTTQCYYLDDEQTWPARLQAQLKQTRPNVWVGNAGLDGHSTIGHEELIKDIISHRHPNVILFLVGINDLALDLSHQPSRYDKRGNWKWRLFTHSRVAQIVYTWALIRLNGVHHVQRVPLIYHPMPLVNPAPVPADLETLVPGRSAYGDRLRNLILLSRSIGSEPIFITQPLLWADTPFWRTIKADLYWVPTTSRPLSAATFSRLMALYNQTLMTTCQAEHVQVIDAAQAMPQEPENYLDMVHFSATGAEQVASIVAEAFLKTHPVEKILIGGRAKS